MRGPAFARSSQATGSRQARDRAAAYLAGLAALGFTAPGPPHLTPLANGNWAEAWRQHFRPVVVGRRLVIAPPWEVPTAAGRVVIVIEPGRAFGTGHHASTAGCLEALETLIEPAPASALDLGTGSGILAIAAVRQGVGRVLAVDEDPDALAAATANAARNGVAERIECLRADAGALDVAAVPLVLANLLTAAHVLAGRPLRPLSGPRWRAGAGRDSRRAGRRRDGSARRAPPRDGGGVRA